VLVGCGALGSVLADQLVRAGVGSLRLIDRDLVELTNLQRQVLFDEADARDGLPKAVAAARRLSRINSDVQVEPLATDFHAGNAESLSGLDGKPGSRGPDLLLDGTDNVETRYLLNDLSVKHGIPWVYAACVGTEGRVMTIRPGITACLRCVFPEPPAAGELPTCDTAGVLGPVAGVVASMQAVAAIKLLCGNEGAVAEEMLRIDLWANRIRPVSLVGAKSPDCPTCGRREFAFLSRRAAAGRSTSLCGRNAVQVRPPAGVNSLDLATVAERLSRSGEVQRTPHLVRCRLSDAGDLQLTIFPDGRLIVAGTTNPDQARSLYARYVGT
jgi:adenylyltransferase/sulfurtransferase